jgi:predicted lipoprotein with Yx(FWY)xxD motif
MRKLPFLAISAALALVALVLTLVAATGASATAAKSPPGVRISTRNVPGLGTVLVNARGRTLYMFVPDKRKRVTCVRTCAAVWPPIKLPRGAKPVAAGRVKASLLGSDPDPAGGRVVTYARWPLYTYVADTRPGVATGQALNLRGASRPTGEVVTMGRWPSHGARAL